MDGLPAGFVFLFRLWKRPHDSGLLPPLKEYKASRLHVEFGVAVARQIFDVKQICKEGIRNKLLIFVTSSSRTVKRQITTARQFRFKGSILNRKK